MLLMWFYLLLSLVALTFGAEFLVRGGVSIAKRLGVSSFFIGLTIVGFGTSTPELATSVAASLRGSTEMAIGNVVGSNSFNIGFILGVTAMIAPVPVLMASVRQEVLSVIGAGILPFVFMYTGGAISRLEGLILVALLFTIIAIQYRRGGKEVAPEPLLEALEDVVPGKPVARESWWRGAAFIVLGLSILVGGSSLLVYSAVEIAQWFGISELVISLTIVAAGTSAPEFFTSLIGALRKQSDIAVGNILGSNIFNMLGILGVSAAVKPQTYNQQVMLLDAPVMLAFCVACLPILLSGRRISRGEGAVLLIAYVAYVFVLIQFVPQWFAG